MGFLDALFPNIELGIKISNQVIRTVLKDKELFAYPVVMAIIAFLLLIIAFVPFILGGGFSLGPLGFVVIIILYYGITTFVATYFLFALYIAFTQFVQGKKIGMGAALAQASGYLTQIIEWTIFYTIVMLVVKTIEGMASRQRGLLGMALQFIIYSIVSIGLFLATTFAIPVMFEERVGPIQAVKKSAMFIINNLGKTFSGIIYFDIIAFVIKFVGVLFILGALFAGFMDVSGTTWQVAGFTILGATPLFEIVALFVIGLAIYIIGVLFNYVTLHIYYLVVYDYVRNKKVPKGMDESLIKQSIQKKAQPQQGQGGGGGGGLFGGLMGGNNSNTDPGDMNSYVK